MLLFLCCDFFFFFFKRPHCNFSFEIIKFTLPYLTLPYTYMHTHEHAHARTHAHTPPCACMRAHNTHTHTHPHMHTHTHRGRKTMLSFTENMMLGTRVMSMLFSLLNLFEMCPALSYCALVMLSCMHALLQIQSMGWSFRCMQNKAIKIPARVCQTAKTFVWINPLCICSGQICSAFVLSLCPLSLSLSLSLSFSLCLYLSLCFSFLSLTLLAPPPPPSYPPFS